MEISALLHIVGLAEEVKKLKKTTQDNSHSVTIAVALHQARLGCGSSF
jgi:hypothetical protein